MLSLILVASLAQPQAGQKVLRADLVRSPHGSNLVLEFAKPVRRTSVPVVPAGRRLVLHLPGPTVKRLAGQRKALGAVRRITVRGDRIILRLNRLARPFADRAVVRVKGRTWRLKMSDLSVERDLADILLGTPKATTKEPFNAFEESQKIAAVKVAEAKAAKEQPVIAEEPAQTAAGLAAIAAAARGDDVTGTDGPADPDTSSEALIPPPIKPSSGLSGPVRKVAGVGLVLLGLLGFIVYRRRQNPLEEAFGLKVVSRAKLDHKSSVAVLEVGGAVLIVGLSDHGPRLLARLDDGKIMDQADESHAEVDALRALVGSNPADRLGAWVNAAQNDRAEVVTASAARVEPQGPTEQVVGSDERVDLRARLAEIRRVCSD
jgi:flagellar biogenesis protein FliO